MQVLPHPIFDTLYIDPDEGLYWQDTISLADSQVPIAFYIETAQEATPEAIEHAAQLFQQLPEFHAKALAALKSSYEQQRDGPVRVYAEAYQGSLPGAPSVTEQETFLSLLHPVLIGIYPTAPGTELIMDYGIGESMNSAAISVMFSLNGSLADISNDL